MDFSNEALNSPKMPSGAYSSQQNMKEKIPSGFKKYQLQNFTPEQMKLHQEMFGHLGPESYLSRLASGDQQTYSEMEAPALRQFNELQGGIASRFSGAGMGGRNSSGFQNTSNAAAQDFAAQLQANRANLRRQSIMDLIGLSNTLLGQQPYTKGFAEKQQKSEGGTGWGQVAGGVIGGVAGMYAGNPYLGATTGMAAGSALESSM